MSDDSRIIPTAIAVWAEIEVDIMATPPPTEELYEAARRGLTVNAARWAEDVTPGTVTLVRERQEPSTFRNVYGFRWMPGPEAQCEFVGGAFDGEMMRLPREADLLPPPLWRVPLPHSSSVFRTFDRLEPIARLEDNIVNYKLIGFRPHTAVWVYELT